MSAIPKWMPKGDYKLLHLGHVTKNADAMFRRLGLRAQVAVLEELVSESRSEPCLSALITHKIITLRKEIDG